MASTDRPWLRRQAYVLTHGTMTAPRSPARVWRVLRRLRYLASYLRSFMWVVVLRPEVLWRQTERTILWGKIRRAAICCVPGLALHLKRKHRLTGGCTSCGTSCNLLLRCPHWDEPSRLCSIYDDRPLTCRLFPITPSDLKDRDLASSGPRCGYAFVPDSSRLIDGRKPVDLA